jgi:HD-GYP domain-containing protein (c-di-GMP phosphodiesterase class II)
MEELNQDQMLDDNFFGVPEQPEENVSELSSEVAEEYKKAYFYIVSVFQKLCSELKSTGKANGNDLKEAIDVIITSLQTDERMLLGLSNAPYSYVMRHLNEDVYGSIVIHGVNVMIYSLKISIDLGVPEIRLPYVGAAAIYHRLGLLDLSEDKLKASFDQSDVMDEIMKYSQDPGKFIKNITIDDFHIDSIQYLINLVQEDHQMLRKTSLREAMYQYSMVIHLCYEFEILTHQISYGNALSPVDAMKKMRDEMKNYFHPDIIKLFFNKLSIYPLGSFVKLSSNETAKIVAVNEKFIIRPTVMIVLDNEGREKIRPARINLREKPNLYIKKAVVNDYLTEKYLDLF